MEADNWGLWSLVPLASTLVLAFLTRSALVSMLVGVIVGSAMTEAIPGAGVSQLLQRSLGNPEFIWICQIIILIGILLEQFRRAGVLAALPGVFRSASGSRRSSTASAWGVSAIVIDDYFGPLMGGAVARPLTDANRVSREKLAFLLDATTAPVCILFPFAAWGAYMAGLVLAQGGPIDSAEAAMKMFIASIPWNLYAIGILLFSLLNALEWLPDYGPMRRAERRARETGQLLRPGARPLRQDGELEPGSGRADLVLELALPLALVVAINAAGLVMSGAVYIAEAFGAAVVWMFLVSGLKARLGSVAELGEIIEAGVKDVVPALLVVSLAYALNAIAGELGAGEAIAGLFDRGLDADWLPLLAFIATASIAFATGTSWGAFAIIMPVALPAAYALDGGLASTLALQTIGAVAGGGVFGDNASPVSDTTVLAAVGAGSDHMDHVITQLPYAGTVALLVCGIYIAW